MEGPKKGHQADRSHYRRRQRPAQGNRSFPRSQNWMGMHFLTGSIPGPIADRSLL